MSAAAERTLTLNHWKFGPRNCRYDGAGLYDLKELEAALGHKPSLALLAANDGVEQKLLLLQPRIKPKKCGS